MTQPDFAAPQRGHYVSAGEQRRRGGLAKFLIPLLALLLLIGLVIAIVANANNDRAEVPRRAAAPQITAGGTTLLPLPEGGLRPLVEQQATGRDLTVQAVNPNEGFWVGQTKEDRLYVEYGGDVGETESRFVPKAGERVNLTGPVRPAPKDPGKDLRLTPPDAAQVKAEGGFINADRVARP